MIDNDCGPLILITAIDDGMDGVAGAQMVSVVKGTSINYLGEILTLRYIPCPSLFVVTRLSF